ncbi:MAG: peptidoglycan DD-metalloendopeptidase family protein, partial [Alphaproteobacteria bacterium]|nr:peptidoglycan DD-metalloendopeptidase family protein [Alphaproteobacteria bacterium]
DAEAQSVDNPNGGNGVDVLTDKETIDDLQEVAEDKKLVPVKSDYIWPVANGKSKISQHFGANDVDGGIIIDASAGTPVKSIADGVVVIAGVPSGDAAAYGTTVVVKHTAKKTMSIYANLKEAKVAVRQKVKQGTIIGKVGQSGTIARKPQLYFEINDLAGKGRQAVDPEKLLPK